MAALSHNPFDFHETAREFGRSILSGRGARSQTVRAWMKKKQRDLDEHRAWLRSRDYEDDEPARKMQSTIDWWKEALDVVDEARRIKKQPNPLFGFGKKRKTRPSARPGKRSSMTISQAVSAAYQAGARIGDTGAFDGWLEKEGLAGRGAQLRGRLETQFRKGVEEGESRERIPKEREVGGHYRGVRIWKTGEGWHTSIEPESEFDSEKDAKRFVDAERRNPRRVLAPRELPPSDPPAPDVGQFAAIRADDGSIYWTRDYAGTTHYAIARSKGVPPERIVGGGWIVDGDYRESEHSDGHRLGERARASMRTGRYLELNPSGMSRVPVHSPASGFVDVERRNPVLGRSHYIYRGVRHSVYAIHPGEWVFNYSGAGGIPDALEHGAMLALGERMVGDIRSLSKDQARSRARLMIDRILDKKAYYADVPYTPESHKLENPDGASLFLTPGPGLLEEEVMLAGSLFGGKKKKKRNPRYYEVQFEGGELDGKHTVLPTLPKAIQAAESMSLRSHSKATVYFVTYPEGGSWGSQKTSKKYEVDHREEIRNPHGTSRLPVHLSRVLSSNGGGRKIRAWKVSPIHGPLGTITLEGSYPSRGQAERKTVEVVRTALGDWDGKVELQFREVVRG